MEYAAVLPHPSILIFIYLLHKSNFMALSTICWKEDSLYEEVTILC